jgi:carotenoid cleavage dioxygenase-like enzyme
MIDFAITENHAIWFDLSATLDRKSRLPFPHA